MAIQVLTKEVRELIAAGEVVERPASVVKELVENAIDAGASVIEVELKRNGLELIRVTDNGSGIPREEIATAFLRHATSKVSKTADLDDISTLGFRGEALAAICAVSKMRMVTKTKDSAGASDYRIEAGEPVSLDEAGAPDGTSVYVAELFYNTPARMKFLKKDVYEGNAVQTIAEQLALSHPEIAFKLVRDGKQAFSTPGDGDLYAAVYSIFPRDVTKNMVAIAPLSDKIIVTGLVSAPENARASRSLQYFFVNGRFIKSRSASAAAEEACKNLIMQGKHPSFVVKIDMPPFDVDVNAHPAKTEVRFKNDREVFSAIYAAVKIAVRGYAASFSRQTAPENQNVSRSIEAEPKPDVVPTETAQADILTDSTTSALPAWDNSGVGNAGSEGMGFVPDADANRELIQTTLEQAAKVYERKNRGLDIEYTTPLKKQQDVSDHEMLERSLTEDKPSDHIIFIGELFYTYIVAQLNDQVIFIDKHAAHERVLFEEINNDATGVERQMLLEPLIVSLSKDEKQAVLDHIHVVERIGFLADDFGECEIAVREIPTYFENKDVQGAVTEIAVQLASGSNDVTTGETEWLLHSTACRAAIKAGHKSSRGELIHIVAQILDSEIPKYCPHGRPVYFVMDKHEMEKRFGRA